MYHTRHIWISSQPRRILIWVIAPLLICWSLPLRAHAAQGDLDLTFGNGGRVTTQFGGGDSVFALVAQPDGKIVAAGTSSNSDFAVARYNMDGSLDFTFGFGGKVTTDFFGNRDVAVAVALQPDGKIVAAGHAFGGPGNNIVFALARYNSNGSLDSTFGAAGKVTGGGTEAESVLIQPDNKIVVGGHTDESGPPFNIDFDLVRLNPDGTLDDTFGSGGKVTTDFFGREDRIFALALQPDGRIVAAGAADRFAFLTSDFALARYKPNGKLDKSFGIDGKLTTNFNLDNEEALAVALQPDGKIIAAGRTHVIDASFDSAIARYSSDGTLDSTFGAGGKVTTDFSGGFDIANDVAVQPNGKIIVSGWAQNGTSGKFDFGLARYNSNGSLDPGFGSGGRVTTDFFGDDDTPFAMALQFDGKIVVAGLAVVGGVSRFALARYDISKPRIISATASGKTLFVAGDGFDDGAIVLINGKEQSTANDEQSPTTALVVRKGAKKIKPGDTAILQVRNSDGALSQALSFTRLAL